MQCSVKGCEKPSKQKGWCWGHYTRWRKYGDPEISKRATPDANPPETCTIDGCQMPNLAKGLCSKHYSRVYRHSDADTLKILGKGEAVDWLRSHVFHGGDECLTWPFSSKNTQGYGVTSFEGRMQNASAVMCHLAHGEKPTQGHEAAHSCGNGHLGCVNPRHLRWATRSENHADKHGHGTMPKGQSHPFAKLTDAQVAEIRKSTDGMTAIAAKFGISRGYVWELQKGKKRVT